KVVEVETYPKVDGLHHFFELNTARCEVDFARDKSGFQGDVCFLDGDHIDTNAILFHELQNGDVGESLCCELDFYVDARESLFQARLLLNNFGSIINIEGRAEFTRE